MIAFRHIHVPRLDLPSRATGPYALGLAVAGVVIMFVIVVVHIAMLAGGPGLPEPTFPAGDWLTPSRILV